MPKESMKDQGQARRSNPATGSAKETRMQLNGQPNLGWPFCPRIMLGKTVRDLDASKIFKRPVMSQVISQQAIKMAITIIAMAAEQWFPQEQFRSFDSSLDPKNRCGRSCRNATGLVPSHATAETRYVADMVPAMPAIQAEELVQCDCT